MYSSIKLNNISPEHTGIKNTKPLGWICA